MDSDNAARMQCMAVGKSRVIEELEHLRTENERLREALRKISNMGQTNVPDHWDFRVKAREIARAALEEKE